MQQISEVTTLEAKRFLEGQSSRDCQCHCSCEHGGLRKTGKEEDDLTDSMWAILTQDGMVRSLGHWKVDICH